MFQVVGASPKSANLADRQVFCVILRLVQTNKCFTDIFSCQDYSETKEKLVASEVSTKALATEKNLVKEAEKRLMQENQSLLDQQRSQNVLLTNLQSIQVKGRQIKLHEVYTIQIAFTL